MLHAAREARAAILVGIVLSLGLVSWMLQHGPASLEQRAGVFDPSGWQHQRQMVGRFWGAVRWEHVPGLRLTPEKKHQLWNRALAYAMFDDGCVGRPSKDVILHSDDPDYSPVAGGVLFTKRVGTPEILEMAKQVGPLEIMSVMGTIPLTPLSVEVFVTHGVAEDSDAPRSSEGRSRTLRLRCTSALGDWTCERMQGVDFASGSTTACTVY